MSASSAPGPEPGFTVADASVHEIARLVHDANRHDPSPALLRVLLLADGRTEIGVQPLEGDHPAKRLRGLDAPPEWDALGVVASGRTFSPAAPEETVGRAVVTVFVTRRDEVAGTMSIDGGEPLPGPPGGLIVDLLRRGLGLPTDPPPCDTTTYFAACWLAEIVTTCDRDRREPDWEELVWLHPAMATLRAEGDVDPSDFVPAARAFGRVVTWARLRRLLDDGAFGATELEPGDGAWLDDGSFARHVLCTVPPLGALRRHAHRALPGPLSHRVTDALAQLEVPATAWPEPAGSERRSA